jgi:hypothetical protein
MNGYKHESLCPYNPKNTLKIILFLRDYIFSKSSFNKNFCPFPSPKELDDFCRKNKIARVQNIARRYLEDDMKLSDWITELLDYALNNNIITPLKFPYFLQFLYDAWTFHSLEDYRKIYEASIEYENGDPLLSEVFSQDYLNSATIQRLRQTAESFLSNKVPVEKFILDS